MCVCVCVRACVCRLPGVCWCLLYGAWCWISGTGALPKTFMACIICYSTSSSRHWLGIRTMMMMTMSLRQLTKQQNSLGNTCGVGGGGVTFVIGGRLGGGGILESVQFSAFFLNFFLSSVLFWYFLHLLSLFSIFYICFLCSDCQMPVVVSPSIRWRKAALTRGTWTQRYVLSCSAENRLGTLPSFLLCKYNMELFFWHWFLCFEVWLWITCFKVGHGL